MPSPEAPTHYEHSKGIMPGRFDPFFKQYSIDYAEAECGNVESPVGFVMLLEVTNGDIVDWYESQGMSLDDMATHLLGLDEYPLDQGWYITRTDDNGLIWAMTYGTGTLAEESARADYSSAERTYLDWCGGDDEEYDL